MGLSLERNTPFCFELKEVNARKPRLLDISRKKARTFFVGNFTSNFLYHFKLYNDMFQEGNPLFCCYEIFFIIFFTLAYSIEAFG